MFTTWITSKHHAFQAETVVYAARSSFENLREGVGEDERIVFRFSGNEQLFIKSDGAALWDEAVSLHDQFRRYLADVTIK